MGEHEESDRTESEDVRGEPNNREGTSETLRRKGKRPNQSIKLDNWQREILEYTGNIALRAGRQVGKSTIIAMKAAKLAIENDKFSVMVISATERQAYLLFSKILLYLDDNYKSKIMKGKNRPTKSEIKLYNGSVIRCLPTGLDGLGIRGYTINLLIADEAAFIPGDVWPAVIPGLATTGGRIILLSTPFGRQGYFYDCFNDNSFKTWHINAEEVAKERPEPQKTFMIDHQEKQKARMTRLQYAQEYLGEFVDELRQLFSDEVIRMACCLRRAPRLENREYYLGVDIARLGADEGTYEILCKINNEVIEQVENQVTKKKLTTETYDRILYLNRLYNFKKIGIDAGSGSLGVGILDFLIRDPEIKKKVIALNNLSRELDSHGKRKRQLLKEDMYMNMLAMMEKGVLKLLNDDEVIASLRSVQYEYVVTAGKKTTVRIFGEYTHIAEGLVRAAWLANQKHLNSTITWV